MRKITGAFSYSCISVGIAVAVVALMMESLILGIAYMAIVGLAVYLILMNYCRKCPHSMNDSCHHGLPGKIAKKLPYKKTGKYTMIELLIVIVAILITFIAPIIFLYNQSIFIGIYGLLWLIGVLLLRRRVCPKCYNRWCVICPNRVK